MDVLFGWMRTEDPRSNDFLFMQSATPFWIILGVYLWFIFVWGPTFMKNREPYQIDKVLIIYNVLQILYNSYLALLSFILLPFYTIFCNEVIVSYEFPRNYEIFMAYLYCFNKYIDLLDTVFFVLRKKFNQITFLHVFHHVVMAIGSYYVFKAIPGGQTGTVCILNSVVHMFMYTYYLQTILNKGSQGIWWKEYVTLLQLAQFAAGFVIFVGNYFHPTCTYDKSYALMSICIDLMFVYMFGSFYYYAYVKKKKVQTKTE